MSGWDAVHPHVRGEYGCGVFAGLQHQRFTPTCVGNTSNNSLTVCCLTVHPHVRGEYHRCIPSAARLLGSPPRAWGIQPFQ